MHHRIEKAKQRNQASWVIVPVVLMQEGVHLLSETVSVHVSSSQTVEGSVLVLTIDLPV